MSAFVFPSPFQVGTGAVLKGCCGLLAGIGAMTLPLVAADWPQLLGPARDGSVVMPEGKALIEPEAVWDRALGSGFAGPVVADGRVIIAHREGDEQCVDAVDAGTGVLLWQFKRPTDYTDSFGFDNGPRGVPAVADGRVFVHGADGIVDALELASGKLLWSVDTEAEFASPQGYFGRACSPLVVDGLVLLTPGGEKDGRPAGVVALEAKSGQVRWQSVADEAGYASPMSLPGGRLLCWMRNQLWVLETATGAVQTSRPLRSRMDASVNAAQPLRLGDDRVLISAGYGVGLHALKLPSLEPIWQKEGLLDCHYSSPVSGGQAVIFGFDGRQEMGQTLRCVDVEAREKRWQSDVVPGGTLIRVGAQLLVVTEQGELWVVAASSDRLEVLHRVQILGANHRSHPAYADGLLFARDRDRLVAVKVHQ